MRRSALCAAALAWLGCSSNDEPDPVGPDDGGAAETGPLDAGDDATADGGEDGDPDCTGAAFPTTCGADAVVVSADGVPVEVPLSGFAYDRVCDASLADVVTLRVDAPPSGLSITLDAGTVGTYLEAALDGTRLVGLDERNEGTFRQTGSAAQTIAWPDPRGIPLGAGCLAVRPIVRTAAAGTVTARLFVTARATPGTRLPLALFPIEGIDLPPEEVDELVDLLVADLATAGLEAYEARRTPLDRAGDTDLGLDSERRELLASLEPPPGALSIVIAATLEAGLRSTVGVAGGIPGPTVAGTAGSGVVLAIEPARSAGVVDLDLVAQIATHEIGHQLGLFHIVEATGLQADLLEDTDDCPRADFDANGDGTVGLGECPPSVALNRMFWNTVDPSRQVELSLGQRDALAHAVLVGD